MNSAQSDKQGEDFDRWLERVHPAWLTTSGNLDFLSACREVWIAARSSCAPREPQVMARVHNDRGQGEAWLNSVGRTLPDQTPLYAHPAPVPECAAGKSGGNRLRDAREVADEYSTPAAPAEGPTPSEIEEWIMHLDLHLTEHDLPHAGKALRAAWPAVHAHLVEVTNERNTWRELAKNAEASRSANADALDAARYRYLREPEATWGCCFSEKPKFEAGAWWRDGTRWIRKHLDDSIDKAMAERSATTPR